MYTVRMKRIMGCLASCLLLLACKKQNTGNGTGASDTAPLLTAAGWERVNTIPYEHTSFVYGGFDVQDMAVAGDSIAVLYAETYNQGGAGLVKGNLGVYKASMANAVNGKISTKKINPFPASETNMGFGPSMPGFKKKGYFVPNSIAGRFYDMQNGEGSLSLNYTQYGEIDEDGRVVINNFKRLYNDMFSLNNIVHTSNGSAVFANAVNTKIYLNAYNAGTGKWLSDYAIAVPPYYPGYNVIDNASVGSAAGFATSDGDYRAIMADRKGNILILRPNFSNFHFDTLATYADPALAPIADLKIISTVTYDKSMFALCYSNASGKLYEYKWVEGANTILRTWGDIAKPDALTTPQTVSFGPWKYFEIQPDGTAYRLTRSSNGFAFETINSSGVKTVATIASSDIRGGFTFLGYPRFANGYYYIVAFSAAASIDYGVHQLDIYRIKA